MLALLFAALIQTPVSPPSSQMLAYQQAVERSRMVERHVVATRDVETCGKFGYEANIEGLMARMHDLHRTVGEPQGKSLDEFLSDYNAVNARVRAEDAAESELSIKSREAFQIFKRNLEKRCEALVYDHPDWLTRKPTTSVTWMFSWMRMEEELFGKEEE